MKTYSYTGPSMIENQRPLSVSYEGQFMRDLVNTNHNLYIGHSVFNKALYKKKLKMKFDLYNSTWQNETMFLSSISEITNNGAYRSIIDLGGDVVPLIIDDLLNSENHWFYALEAITGINPIKKEHRGDFNGMKSDWIEWAENNL